MKKIDFLQVGFLNFSWVSWFEHQSHQKKENSVFSAGFSWNWWKGNLVSVLYSNCLVHGEWSGCVCISSAYMNDVQWTKRR